MYESLSELQNTWCKSWENYRETRKSTVIGGYFNTLILVIERLSKPKEKSSKFIEVLNNSIEIYKIIPLTTTKYIFFSNAQWTSTKIDNML